MSSVSPVLIIAIVAIAIIAYLLLRGGKKSQDSIAPPQDKSVVDGAATAIEDVAAQLLVAAPSVPTPTVQSATEAGEPDNLQLLKGVGPRAAALLAEAGITRFAQIATWGPDDIATIDARMGAFKGRIDRDRWVEQARLLAAGDKAGFEAQFGKLGSAS
jgi:predicted flap endonuclease-1-like 5' DNA nuclease